MMLYQRSLFEDDIENASTIKDICDALNCSFNTPGWPDHFGEALLQYISSSNSGAIKTLSLFSGAGGLDIGFHDLGFDIIESVEIESKFAETLRIKFWRG